MNFLKKIPIFFENHQKITHYLSKHFKKKEDHP